MRDIEACLRSRRPQLYHLGLRGEVARSTLAEANESRDWRIFSDFAHVLIEQASALYADEPFGVELKQAAYALDFTTIDLCLSLFPWAKFRRHKAAIKLHTLLTLRGNFPTVVILTFPLFMNRDKKLLVFSEEPEILKTNKLKTNTLLIWLQR